MPTIWFTADTHFGHENIIKHCGRPFQSANHMDAVLIENLWARVGPPRHTLDRGRLRVWTEGQGPRLAGSTIITSQLPLSTWHDVIGEPTFADAILDRIVHNAYRLELTGQSMRKTKANGDDKPEN